MNNTELPIDTDKLTDTEYKARWKDLSPIEIKMIEKHGECKHDLHDTFHYENPYERPPGVCTALLNVLDNYTWRVALGFPSWEEDDRGIYRIHCPDRSGTVWQMRRVEKKE